MRKAARSKRVRGSVRIAPDAQDHGQDAHTGNHLDEGIDAESEQGEGFILRAKPDGDQPFDQVVDDGENSE